MSQSKKFLKRPNSRAGKSATWKGVNNSNTVSDGELRKKNNKLKKELTKLGWKVWDGYNGEYDGYTISFKKYRSDNPDSHLIFSWHWASQGGPYFWMGEMNGFYNYEEGHKTMHPHGRFQIWNITERDVKQLSVIEDRITGALLTQTPLK